MMNTYSYKGIKYSVEKSDQHGTSLSETAIKKLVVLKEEPKTEQTSWWTLTIDMNVMITSNSSQTSGWIWQGIPI